MASGVLPPGHRLEVRRRQALQAAQHGRRLHGTHLPMHPLPNPPQSRRQTNHKEGTRARKGGVYSWLKHHLLWVLSLWL